MQFQMIDPILSITAAMSVQSPFTNRAYTDSDAIVSQHASLKSRVTVLLYVYVKYVNLFSYYDILYKDSP